MLEYSLAAPAGVRLEVYGINGSRVKTLVDRTESAGEHTIGFDLRSDDGRALRAGVYLVRLVAGSESRTIKLVAVD
jgi:flagellar hook assembly protein FlgD